MPIYLVTPLTHNADQIGERVRATLSSDQIFEVQGRAGWLVNYPGTSVELSNLIGITSATPGAIGTLGAAMVTSVGTYYGVGSTSMWEWLKTRVEGQR